jgi:hypothetical protein
MLTAPPSGIRGSAVGVDLRWTAVRIELRWTAFVVGGRHNVHIVALLSPFQIIRDRRIKRLAVVTGVIACFKSLLVAVAVLFQISEGRQVSAVGLLVLSLGAYVPGDLFGRVTASGGKAVRVAGAITAHQRSRLIRLLGILSAR